MCAIVLFFLILLSPFWLALFYIIDIFIYAIRRKW